jgi:hypothetical protein
MMLALLLSLAMFAVDFFKPRRRLVAENLFLRHQLSIALRRAPPRLRLRGSDRALLVWMTRVWPSLLGAARVIQPPTTLVAKQTSPSRTSLATTGQSRSGPETAIATTARSHGIRQSMS